MFDNNELLVPFVTDVAYGVLFFVGLIGYVGTQYTSLSIGFTVGSMFGYTIHTAAHMFGYSVNTNLRDEDQ